MLPASRVPPIETSRTRRTSQGCPTEATLARYVEQSLSPEEQTTVGAHLETCEACDMAVAMFGSVQRQAGAPSTTSSVHSVNESLAAFMRRAKLAQEFKEGSLVGRFRILRQLGQGSMGVVYAAYDPQLDRNVALKVLLEDRAEAEWADATSGGGRLLREARSMARLTHANIVTVFEVGLTSGRLFLAMELVEGVTLGEWLSAPGARTIAQIIDVFVDVARAVDAAHRAGVVHRDLKPQNILVTKDGTPKITDFGIADAAPTLAPSAPDDAPTLQMHLPERHGLVGTPAYMAPEVLLGSPAKSAADQFSLAVCLHEAISGRRPYAAGSVAELQAAVAREPAQIDPAVPPALRPVLARALDRDPSRRHATMGSFAEVLLEAQNAAAVPAMRSRGWAFGAAGLLALAAFGVASALVLRPTRSGTGLASAEPPPSPRPSAVTAEPALDATPPMPSGPAATGSAPPLPLRTATPRSTSPRRPAPTASPKKTADDGADWLERRK